MNHAIKYGCRPYVAKMVPLGSWKDSEQRLRSGAGKPIDGSDGNEDFEPVSMFLPLRTPIKNQRAIGSCVWHAITSAIEHEMGAPLDLSELAGYWLSRRLEGDGSECRDEGCSIPTSCVLVTKHGFCREEYWPYREELVNQIPSESALAECYRNISPATSFVRVLRSGLKSAICQNKKVVFGAAINGEDWSDYIGDRVLQKPATSQGGHATLLVGFIGENETDENITDILRRMGLSIMGAFALCSLAGDALRGCWIGQNSWGEDWGLNGFYFISDDYIKDLMWSYDFNVLK